MIQGWLAGKLSGLIIFCVACAAVPLAIVATVQTVRLNGISLLGWHIVDGAVHGRELAEAKRDAALRDLGQSRANTKTVTAALDEANASIRDLHRQSDLATADAQRRLEQEKARRAGLQKQLANIVAAHIDTSSPGAAAVSLDALIMEGVQ